jgi:hypothetical protein
VLVTLRLQEWPLLVALATRLAQGTRQQTVRVLSVKLRL